MAKKAIHVHVYAEVWGFLWLVASLLTFLSLVSYDGNDLSINTSHPNPQILNFIGPVGAWWSFVLFFLFGMGVYLVPLLFASASVAFFLKQEIEWGRRVLWAGLLLVAVCGLFNLQPLFGIAWAHNINADGNVGGFVGYNIKRLLLVLGPTGAGIILSSLAVTSLIFLYRLQPVAITAWVWNWAAEEWNAYQERKLEKEGTSGQIAVAERKLMREQQTLEKTMARQVAVAAKASAAAAPAPAPEKAPEKVPVPEPRVIDTSYVPAKPAPLPEKEPEELPPAPVPSSAPAPEPAAEKAPEKAFTPRIVEKKPEPRRKEEPLPESYEGYRLPPLDLLKPNTVSRVVTSEAELLENAQLLVTTLATFGIEVTGGDITKGATITRYEVYPAAGVRVDRIVSLQRDLARALKAERINILAPIPGKDSVGIEIPNTSKVPIVLRDLFDSHDWTSSKAKIPLALGKDVYGQTLVADLAEMPHLLIAGTTGSGKSVCINSILLSLLYKFTPADLRLILVDPKQVEMQVYNGAPHLVVPVVVDAKKVLVALNWVVKQMEERYRLLARTGVRNIAAFNSRDLAKEREKAKAKADADQLDLMASAEDEGGEGEDGAPINEDEGPRFQAQAQIKPEDPIPDRLPYIVVIIDELADLMQTTGADVELAIVRICQKARAAGIHLIVATQTPRREVITSLIKTNIPSRVAFQVPSALDSRVILDENGAENLLGKGDMLYLPPGSGKTLRGQGAFVSDAEVQEVVEFVSKQAPPAFDSEIHRKLNPGGGGTDENVSDEDKELVMECLETIRQEKRASTSMLQRRLRLGYNRAAWVVDFLERQGILGPENGAKPRDILVDLDQFDPDSIFGG